ncbi:MAG: hypothetical protein JXA51_01785 [Dehalococcoidales bacterium]|nr:hypothetical protein [Dehalococcoidales bacterium]
MKTNYSIAIGIFITCTGIAVFILSFFVQNRELQIALLVAAAGLIVSGIAQLGQAQEKKEDEKKHQEMISKLEEINTKLEKKEEAKGSGVVIADVIGAGMKYYAEHLTTPDKEEEGKEDTTG